MAPEIGRYRRSILLGVALACFYGYVVWRGAARTNDFRYPYIAAQALWRTSRLHVRAQPRYPISFHVLLSPLSVLPIGAAAAVWALLSFAAVAALPIVLERLSGIAPRRQALGWLLVSPCLIDALVLGQSDPINLFLVSAGLAAALGGRDGLGAGLVGLAGMIKILPALHWATLAARCRSPRALLGIAGSAGIAFGLLVAAVGFTGATAGVREQVRWIHEHEKPWHLVARGTDLRVNNESLPIVLARTLGDLGPVRPRHALSLGLVPLEALWWAWGAVLVALGATWLACARRSWTLPPRRAWLGMFALTSIVMLAGTPICWHHYFLWLLPAALFLAHRPRVLAASTCVGLLATAVPTVRGVGGHMLLALALFATVAREMVRGPLGPRREEVRDAVATGAATPGSPAPAPGGDAEGRGPGGV